VKGSSTTLKQGSKVKSIRLVDDGDHEVDCKMDAGNFMLKACFLKKA
jgi:protein PhnA